ncbi:amino acid adenylation domain-containing protein [Pedobacter sp. PF22-3]|uniref:amino acid adenylation domain-containing protein n=1 Tax=Pedobacter sp. PF22-3 TaxID=2994467 RepID=UPI0022479C1D|nr:amino acid adenylation domain-containing protein [Pedobacter sp. PF22-3]MCX2492859.1 amino acid adenylation domain-containing protein [Pedobacter sp. PF22-3]
MTFQSKLNRSLQSNRDRVAIEYGDRKITYAALQAEANTVTAYLLERKTPKEAVIGISGLERSDIIAAMIGVINAGCVFVLLDEAWPENRLNLLLKELNLNGLITSAQHKLPEKVTSLCNEIMLWQQVQEHQLAGKAVTQALTYSEDDSLYIYFTSGSTGKPKGIVGRNGSLLHFLNWELEAFNIKPDFRVSQFISPYFDAFLRDVFVPLFAGATLCIPPSEQDFYTPEKLIPWIHDQRITIIHCVPSIFRVFNHAALLTQTHFPVLKYVLLSGEKIAPAELGRWYDIFNDRIQLVNLYGATETTLIRSCYLIRPEDAATARIPIGFPIADTELAVLGEDLTPCNVLVQGDLYILSDYFTKGYLNDASLTQQKFVPIDTGNGPRMSFKTGDKARMLANGVIELMGREDRMVKIRGIRIELDEIEYVLAKLPFLKNGIVVKQEDEKGNESLVAFVVKAEDSEEIPDMETAVISHLREFLPAYMVPSSVVRLTALPLLASGKIDYKSLEKEPGSRQLTVPANKTEAGLLAIWKEILGDKPISVDDSFHKIGGNSLSIMKLIGRIYKEYNVRITLGDLFKNLTIQKQAVLISKSNKHHAYVIQKAAVKPFYQVSQAQERMYYNQQLNKESVAYNLPMAMEINGDIDKTKLEQVFQQLINRHEAFRTQFLMNNGEVVQEVRENVDFKMELIHIDSAALLYKTIAEFNRPFELDKAPLIRCAIISNSEDKNILAVHMHHIICDGISQGKLFAELLALYNDAELKPLNWQYKDYAEWEYAFRQSEEFLSLREFWLGNFEGTLPVLELPTANMDTTAISDHGSTTAFEIEKEKLELLLALVDHEEITLFAVLFALNYLFLWQITGQDDLVIGTVASGRMQHELEDVVGMFVKTLPVRYKLDADITFKEMLAAINQLLIQANSKQWYDLTNIIAELNQLKKVPVANLFDAMFVYQDVEEGIRGEGDALFTRLPQENSAAKYPLTLFAVDNGHSIGFKLEYLTAYFSAGDIDLLISQLKLLAEKVAQQPGARISEIFGSTEKSAQVLDEDISFNF